MGFIGGALYGMGALAAFVLWKKKRLDKTGALLLAAGSLLAFGIWAGALAGKEQTLQRIKREPAPGGQRTLKVEAEAEGERREMELSVSPQAYGEEELQSLCEAMWEEVEKGIAGENESLDRVTGALNFPERVAGYPFTITWSSSDPQTLSQEGKPAETLSGEGRPVRIEAKIRAEGQDYTQIRSFYVKVFPSQEKEAFWKRLQGYLEELEAGSRTDTAYPLPEEFEGKKLSFHTKEQNKSGMFFLLGIVGAAALTIGKKKEAEKKKREREEKLEQEYPNMILRMAMLIGAGMSIPGALRRIAGEYSREKQKEEKPLYEELAAACREMESGVSESSAYRNLGARCGQPGMVRFSALLTQYGKSGARGLKKELQEEAQTALQERKERARRLGEEAGTKLLLPMTMMLVMVMALIMIPAFTSFGG